MKILAVVALGLVLVGVVTGGLPGGLVMLGLVVLAAGVLMVIGMDTFGIRSRRWGAGVLVSGLVLMALGGAAMDPGRASLPDLAESSPTSALGPGPAPATPLADSPTATTPASDPAATWSPPSPTAVGEGRNDTAGTALVELEELEVRGRASKTGYDRDLFGYGEVDLDRNGCNVRSDILRRDLRSVVLETGTNGCVVESGVLPDPYSGDSIDFAPGSSTSRHVEIEHVVALSDAWQKGAQQWDEAKLGRFGNDPLNLLAVDGSLNAQKGDGDTATWLPPNKAFRCEYVARQITVKRTYDLWVTQAEAAAMGRVLSDCPQEPLVSSVQVSPPAEPDLAPAPEPDTVPGPEPGIDPRFDTCGTANDAGYGPYVEAVDPEYAWYRDADRDGTTCEIR